MPSISKETTQFVHGTYQEDLPNRFLCKVLVNGQIEECYVPASFKISRLINLKDREVLLQYVTNANSRTRFSLYAVKFKHNYILLNLNLANYIVFQQLHRKYFSFLGKRDIIRKEITLNNYKCDLLLEDTKTVIEIKTLISSTENGCFPAVYSERAIVQLNKIYELLSTGYRACYIIISMNPYLKCIYLNKADSKYHQIFNDCLSKGMKVKAFSIFLQNGKPNIKKEIPIYL